MTLFAYPPQAIVNRVLPKNKVYANATISARLRQAFVADLHQIVWRAKLAPETIRLTATRDVPEIQVFELALKGPDFNEDIARTIDAAIPFPIVFELTFEGKIRTLAAWKRPTAADPTKWMTGDYLETPWQPADAPRQELPVALDMGGLYEQILRAVSPHPARRGETLAEHMERLGRIRTLQTESDKLERKLTQERQFNRKVEINARLRAITDDIAALSEHREAPL
ncbi:MAG: DUF4391 domain-containing protein [Rhodospirillales bacterium]|nr:DUF4391 domain-containing protein [Rhodospirillales bacterium]